MAALKLTDCRSYGNAKQGILADGSTVTLDSVKLTGNSGPGLESNQSLTATMYNVVASNNADGIIIQDLNSG